MLLPITPLSTKTSALPLLSGEDKNIFYSNVKFVQNIKGSALKPTIADEARCDFEFGKNISHLE
ncbi:hypothetical protein BCT33_01790 [Vibrio lentus]|uniref:Uncharacterized protein n=1 Tax=Vibrio lentus TaxID=136468 RepID=A0A855IWH9_9VIBR|nr:hypothetical protein BCU18_15470 [Vibrio lentus]PMJ81453.1 hypothetical protein BCU14_17940 [Vibrio lentus]PMM56491.1 hypothetical protein BCT51_06870 [Vibrio lentus]PMM62880.1 hypothetical protein BCT50_00075 [Vibrio lentus]PMN38384.1 hypothetical protein BCT33_01790 [Vibrio lentus]